MGAYLIVDVEDLLGRLQNRAFSVDLHDLATRLRGNAALAAGLFGPEGLKAVAVADWTTKPIGSSRPTRSAKFLQFTNPGVGHRGLGEKIPVFSRTSRATRSAFSTANRRPIGPPQSWTTTVADERSRSLTNSVTVATWRS